jgi:hypothetical protein
VSPDGDIDLKKFDGEVPDLGDTLDHYVDDITAPLPAPKYSVGFEENINQFVSNQQEERYEDLIDEERRYQERKWTWAFRQVAERHPDLDPSGVRVRIEVQEEDSPIQSLSAEEVDKVKAYASALDTLAGPASAATTLVDDETLRDLILQLPEDSLPGGEAPVDESDADVEAQFRSLLEDGDDVPRPEGPPAEAPNRREAVEEALAEFRAGEAVEVGDQRAVIIDTINREFTWQGETVDGSGDETYYLVADEEGSRLVAESAVSASDWDSDVETGGPSDLDEAEAAAEAPPEEADGKWEALDIGFDSWPDSWEEADTPARLIALDAWTSMGATFRGCRAEGLSRRVCAAFKDEILQTTEWRGKV